MTTQANPNVTVNIVSALTQVANQPQKVLFVGQKLAAGTAVAGELQSNIQNDNSWDALFGGASQLSAMIRAARLLNQVTQFDAIALDDAGGAVDATGTITFVGTATEAGTLEIVVGSEQNHKVSVAVADTDSETDVADAATIAINASTNVPVLASNTAGVLTVTALNGGTYGNTLGIESIGSVAGITGSAVAAMASGATDPTLTGVFDVVGDTRYQGVVWPYADDTSVLRTFLDARFNVDNDVLDGVGFTSKTDTLANLTSTYGALNSQSLLVDGDKQITETNYKGPSVIEIPAVKAAMTASLRGLRLTAGASVADIVISRTGGLDSFGGPALASKPYFNTPLTLIPVTRNSRGWTLAEIETLNGATTGVSTMGNNRAGNQIILGEQVTTYKTDSSANPDVSFKYLNYVDTASNAREFFVNQYRATYAQSRLTEGDLVPGRDMANQAAIEAATIGFFATLSGPEFVLTQAGETARRLFLTNLIVSLDLSTGTVTIDMAVPLVTQLRNIAATMRIVFSTEG